MSTALDPLKKPGNWIDLLLVGSVYLLAAHAPTWPAWTRVVLGLGIVLLRVLHRWWSDSPPPAVTATRPVPPIDPPYPRSNR